MSALIVVPVFDEAATLGPLVARARRHAPVLVVDDGSRDGSADIARAAGADVLRHARRAGKGAALSSGIEAARRRGATRVVTLDGDGQHDPDDVPRMLEASRRRPDAIVIGSRLHQAERMPPARAHAMRVATFFVSWATGLPSLDTQSGFRVYPLASYPALVPRRGGFVWETEILVRAAARGIDVVEVPVTVISRAARPSRFGPVTDGFPIAAYLAAPVLARWGAEAAAAAREVGRLFDAGRLRARHGEMWRAAAALPAPLWGPAITRVVVQRAAARLRTWWRHPRRHQAALAAPATLAAPAVLGLLALQGACGGALPDAAGPLVRRLYDADRLGRCARRDLAGATVTPGLPPVASVR